MNKIKITLISDSLPFGSMQVMEVGVMTTLNWTDH